MEGLTTIHLGGKLGQLFGKRWDLMVSSPAEAIRAIDVNLRGNLKTYLSKDGAKKFYRIAVGKKDCSIGKEEIYNRSGSSDIFILPAAKGAGSGGGKIFAGLAIIALGILTSGASWAAIGFQGAGLIGGQAALGIGLLGASMVLGGITQLLTPAPNFNNNAEGESRGSNLFGGNASTITQGGGVGLVYGRALVTPMPVSISFDNTDQIKPDAAGTVTYCEKVSGTDGDLVQYVPVADGAVCP